MSLRLFPAASASPPAPVQPPPPPDPHVSRWPHPQAGFARKGKCLLASPFPVLTFVTLLVSIRTCTVSTWQAFSIYSESWKGVAQDCSRMLPLLYPGRGRGSTNHNSWEDIYQHSLWQLFRNSLYTSNQCSLPNL